ncbi:MAG: FemAB superfamily protein [Fibrobacteres bacterium]|nr:FemAB superfamily protein [Fibrobacterota bacterium]
MIRLFDPGLEQACREFLGNSPQANYCHDPAWMKVIKEAYDKEAFAFVRTDPDTGAVKGMAPACFLASAAFGKNLVCLPYLDYGGILAEDSETEDLLRDKLVAEAQARRAQLEIRSRDPLCGLPTPKDDKVSMILPLSERDIHSQGGDWRGVADPGPVDSLNADGYWKGLDAKVRNQVRKAEKSGVTVVWGREDRLDDFYEVFCVNMRDLGSPTHARGFFEAVLRHFPGARIGTAHREGKCIGGLFRILWKNELAIPWASTLKDERIHCPNNALYWESIRFAFEAGCRLVDFGRSTRDEGTYRFKKQWQARELPLYRYQFDEKGHFLEQSWHVAQGKLGWTRNIWAKLPLKLANSLGPMLRGSISA